MTTDQGFKQLRWIMFIQLYESLSSHYSCAMYESILRKAGATDEEIKVITNSGTF